MAVPHRDSGKIAKTLTLQKFEQGQDWYLQLSVKDASTKENSVSMGLPISGPELYTLKTLAEVSLTICLHRQSSKSLVAGVPAEIAHVSFLLRVRWHWSGSCSGCPVHSSR